MRASRVLFVAILIDGAAPGPDPQCPSLCVPHAVFGFPFEGGQWRVARLAERRYIQRALTDEDRQGYPGFLESRTDPPGLGRFDFGSGYFAGWCTLYGPPGIKPKYLCGGYSDEFAVDLESGKYERFSRSGFIGGDPGEGLRRWNSDAAPAF